MTRIFTITTAFALCHTTMAANTVPQKNLGSLSLLPDGTMLNGVSIPRYSSDLKPIALVKADVIKKVNDQQISITKLSLLQFNQDGKKKLAVNMDRGDYNPTTDIVTSFSPLSVSNDRLATRGRGVVLDVENQVGFLIGPTHSVMELDAKEQTDEQPNTNASTPQTNKNQKASTEPSGLPAIPSENKLRELDLHLSQKRPDQSGLKQAQRHVAKVPTDLRKEITPFLKTHLPNRHQSILTSSGGSTTVSSTTESGKLNITCDGGMFYDAPKGLLSYLKNIKVSEPRLKIECSDDLQVHLTTKEEKKKVQNSKGIKKIIAIGAVKIDATVVDKKTGATRTLKGSAAVVEFDYVSGVTTFKGGFPSLEITVVNGKSKQSFTHRSKQKDQWIVVQQDGSFRTSGKTEQNVDGLNSRKP